MLLLPSPLLFLSRPLVRLLRLAEERREGGGGGEKSTGREEKGSMREDPLKPGKQIFRRRKDRKEAALESAEERPESPLRRWLPRNTKR